MYFKQDRLAMIQFLDAEGCKAVEIYCRVLTMCVNDFVLETMAKAWFRQLHENLHLHVVNTIKTKVRYMGGTGASGVQSRSLLLQH